MLVEVIKDGPKNFSVLVKGGTAVSFTRTPIIDLKNISPPREGWKGLRLDSAVWLVQEKLCLHLWWEDKSDPEALVMPMESRNSVRFEEGMPSPRVGEEWRGVMYLSSTYPIDPKPVSKWYMVILDFDKQ